MTKIHFRSNAQKIKDGFFEISLLGIDLREVARIAYEMSVPVGLGLMHARPGGLDDDTVDALMIKPNTLRMDYIHGRCCKFNVFSRKGIPTTPNRWYDHSIEQLVALMHRIGIEGTIMPHSEVRFFMPADLTRVHFLNSMVEDAYPACKDVLANITPDDWADLITFDDSRKISDQASARLREMSLISAHGASELGFSCIELSKIGIRSISDYEAMIDLQGRATRSEA